MRVLLILLGFILVNSTSAQDSNWVLQQSTNGVEFYIGKTDCIKPKNGTAIEYLLIKVVNTTDDKLKISFKKEVWYDNKCSSCEDENGEFDVNLTLTSEEEVSGSCNVNDNSLKIFSKMLNLDNVRKLSKLELKNIQIEKFN